MDKANKDYRTYEDKVAQLSKATRECEAGITDYRTVARLTEECKTFRIKHGIDPFTQGRNAT